MWLPGSTWSRAGKVCQSVAEVVTAWWRWVRMRDARSTGRPGTEWRQRHIRCCRSWWWHIDRESCDRSELGRQQSPRQLDTTRWTSPSHNTQPLMLQTSNHCHHYHSLHVWGMHWTLCRTVCAICPLVSTFFTRNAHCCHMATAIKYKVSSCARAG